MTTSTDPAMPLAAGETVVVLGLGVTGRAVCRALVSRGHPVVAIDDRPTDETVAFAAELGIVMLSAPDAQARHAVFTDAAAFIPSPGIPESHGAFSDAAALGVRVLSEFDLARWWDDRPIAAVTGTNGKTTVTLLTVALLEASGIRAAAVGNTEIPFVELIDDPSIEVFVVEASSFRLGHGARFSPDAAAWLNFSPDHLDVHASMESYEAAKAKIWDALPDDGLAVAVAGDAIVERHLPAGRACTLVSHRTLPAGDRCGRAHVVDAVLHLDDRAVIAVAELPRQFTHDITNALVAAALADHLGASLEGIAAGLRAWEMPPHRIQFVETIDDVTYYNDSKATVPHAVIAATELFDSVVLIAGGKNKGLDLSALGTLRPRTRRVIAIGDAAPSVVEAFGGDGVEVATDMDDAVKRARTHAQPGDVVLLSPGCASFDAYPNYGARGDHFMSIVRSLAGSEESP